MNPGRLAWLLVLPFLAPDAVAQTMVTAPNDARFTVKVRSFVDLRFTRVIRQRYDVSCGAAALGTLLKYFYGEDLGEQEIIDGILAFGDKEKIKKDGFSMLELKRYSERRGFVAKGYRIPDPSNLAKLRVPVITLVNTRGYNHFVVLKGVRQGRVFIADPAFGNISRPLAQFVVGWTNVILVLLSPDRRGDNAFTLDPMLKAPLGDQRVLLDRGLLSIRPGAGEF